MDNKAILVYKPLILVGKPLDVMEVFGLASFGKMAPSWILSYGSSPIHFCLLCVPEWLLGAIDDIVDASFFFQQRYWDLLHIICAPQNVQGPLFVLELMCGLQLGHENVP